MYKKTLSILLAGVLTLTAFSACSEKHTHLSNDPWEFDLSNHWKTCAECEEHFDEGSHSLDEDNNCTVCGTQIIDWGDTKSAYLFNEDGDPVNLSDYDADGNLVSQTITRYTYDDNGNLTHSITTIDGTVTEENSYTTANGETVLSQNVNYWEDGSKSVSDYDANENAVRVTSYGTSGEMEWQDDYEYALAADGEWYEVKCTEVSTDGSKIVSEQNENGNQTHVVHYDVDGSVIFDRAWEYTYDDEGQWQVVKYYESGVLSTESVYKTAATEDGTVTYPETVTAYNEDGTTTVTAYDENDNILQQTTYDADGNEIQ